MCTTAGAAISDGLVIRRGRHWLGSGRRRRSWCRHLRGGGDGRLQGLNVTSGTCISISRVIAGALVEEPALARKREVGVKRMALSILVAMRHASLQVGLAR